MGAKTSLLRFGGPEAAEPAERRRSGRHMTVFQIAKIVTPQSQELCILRDISDTGLRAELYSPAVPGETVTFEMRTGHRVSGRIVWHRERSIGVQFDHEISVPEVLAHCSFDDRLGRMRPPRIEVEIPAIIMVERQLIDVVIRNISQAGMKVACAETLVPGAQIVVRFVGIGQRMATVRWSRHGESGLQLAQALTYGEFVAWRGECLRAG